MTALPLVVFGTNIDHAEAARLACRSMTIPG